MREFELDFNTMLKQFKMMRKMGDIRKIVRMIPGLANAIPEEALSAVNDKQVNRIEAIILSMTPKERTSPDIIDGSRKQRLAAGSGTTVDEVSKLLAQLFEMRRSLRRW